VPPPSRSPNVETAEDRVRSDQCAGVISESRR
jgi:hypothetical protein